MLTSSNPSVRLHDQGLKNVESHVHPSAQPGDDRDLFTVTPLGGCVRLRLTGHVDPVSHDELRSILAGLRTDGITAIHLEMSKLDFIDIAGTRELMMFAQAHPRLRLILHDPPASLRRIVTLLGPGTNIEIRVSSPLEGHYSQDGDLTRSRLTGRQRGTSPHRRLASFAAPSRSLPAEGMAPMSTYTVRAKRWKHGWELHIDGIGVTQSRNLGGAEQVARDYIETLTDHDTADDVVIIQPVVGGGLDEAAQAAREAVAEAEQALRAAAARSRQIARRLKQEGLSGTDIAAILHVSAQRVSQLLNSFKDKGTWG